METLQSIIFIEFDVNTKKITFLRGDNIVDYDSNATSIYARVKYRNLSGNTVYLTPSELEDYKFSLYTIKPTTNNVNVITGEVTDELKENVYGGVVKFEIPRVCTNRLGIVKCEIHINQGNKMIGSRTFVLDVKQSLVTAFDDELLGDEDFPVLKQLILEIQKDSNIDDNNRSKITTYSSDKIEIIKENLKEDFDSQIKDNDNKIENIKEDLSSQIKENSYNIDNIETIIEGINCSPKDVYTTLKDLKSAFPNGDNNIYVVSEDGGWYYWKETEWLRGGDYQSNIISDESIGLRHVNFIENINYFNKSNILINGYYNHETFEWNDLEGVSQTEDIHCEPGDIIYFTARSNSDTYKAVFKNNNKNIIKGVFIDNTTAHDNLTFCFKVPSGVNYFTLMFYNNQIDTFMITINKPCPLLYRPYNGLKNLSSSIHIDGDNITPKAIEKKHINYKVVEDYIYDYEDGSVNVFNTNNMLANGFWNAETLEFINYEGINFSNFIKCVETDVIRIKVNNIGSSYHVVFKNKKGEVFKGIFYENYSQEIITITDIPKDACYFGVNVYEADVDSMMITINNSIPSSYQEYKPSKLELSDNLISAIKLVNEKTLENYIVDYKDGSTNIFNKNNMLENCFWSAETLEFINYEGINFSNFIKCTESDVIRIKVNNIGSNYHVVFKNKEGEVFDSIFYEKYPNEIITIRDIPKDTWSFGVNLYEADVDSMMITINNSIPSSYQEYKPSKLELSDNLISAIKLVNEKTLENYIVDYKDGSTNIFNKNNMLENCFWSAETLEFINYEGINFSNFIKCTESDVIRIKVNNIGSNYHVVFKNKEGEVFDSIFYEKYPNEIITIRDIPKDIWSFGVNVYKVDIDSMMITINNEIPSLYEEYKPSKLELNDSLISAIKSIYGNNNDNSSDDDYLANRLLVWEEDFSGNEIDRTSWMNLCRKDGSGNNQLEYNTARSKNCRIVNNQLIIEARREHYKGKEWTSANLNTSNLHEFQYGRIEAKIKLPNSHGIWPAFWMMGANTDLSTDENDEFVYTGVDWPTCGEIDIFEYWGRNSCGKLGGAVHYAKDINNTLESKQIYEVLEGQNNYDPTQWHIYGIEWTEDKMDFLVDNEVKGTVSLEQFTLSNGYNPFRLPHYLILNVAVDIADNTTDKNNLMFVDWVRVYAPENVESYVNPTGITLNTNEVTLNVGDERVPSLQANILPIDASEKTVIWESSDSDIVVVGGGALTAKKQGTCEIIARTLNGYEARCVVTVN